MAKRFVFADNTKITALIADPYTQSTWVANQQDSNGDVILKRKSAFDPNQTYFTLSRSIDKMVAFDIDADYLYVAYEDSSLIGEKFYLTAPTSINPDHSIPAGVTELPVDIAVDSTRIFYLMPGDGIDATIAVITKLNVFDQIITLTGIQDAKNIVADNNDELWVTTYTDPVKLIRVYETSPDVWAFQTTLIS